MGCGINKVAACAIKLINKTFLTILAPMDELSVKALLEDLKKPDESVRDRATTELWRTWFNQKGEYGMQILRRSQVSLEAGDVRHALDLLTKLISEAPDFAEAWNRRAVLHYTQGNYKKSLQDCQTVLKLNPVHFGALHGLGLCYAALGEYINAIQAFRRALEIQPFALVNQKLILECTARLS
jgi:tetratricopeptide (TPR) repeat protein